MPAPAVAPPPASKRKRFARTRVPRAERTASIVIIGLLAVTALIIWHKGRHYDPSRYALRTEALRSTAATVEGKSGTVLQTDVRPEEAPPATRPTTAAESDSGSEPAEGAEPPAGATKAAAPATGEPLELKLSGLEPMSPTEFYNADNLFEKIDGRAPAYQGFDFQQLLCRSFSVTGAAGSFVDVFEYRFDTPINAFGMFALERDPKGKPLDFAPDGYAGEMGYFFRVGPRYVQVIASDQKATTLTLTEAIARDRAKTLPADDRGLDARRRLPATGLEPGSVAFVQDNAQGQAFLKNVFQATYDFGGKKLPFFLMLTTPAEAAAAHRAYAEFCGQFGGKVTPLPDSSGAKLFLAENFGTWKVIFQRAGELGGVVDADDAAKAQQFVEQYLQGKIP